VGSDGKLQKQPFYVAPSEIYCSFAARSFSLGDRVDIILDRRPWNVIKNCPKENTLRKILSTTNF